MNDGAAHRLAGIGVGHSGNGRRGQHPGESAFAAEHSHTTANIIDHVEQALCDSGPLIRHKAECVGKKVSGDSRCGTMSHLLQRTECIS
jgi:hypothetical protein